MGSLVSFPNDDKCLGFEHPSREQAASQGTQSNERDPRTDVRFGMVNGWTPWLRNKSNLCSRTKDGKVVDFKRLRRHHWWAKDLGLIKKGKFTRKIGVAYDREDWRIVAVRQLVEPSKRTGSEHEHTSFTIGVSKKLYHSRTFWKLTLNVDFRNTFTPSLCGCARAAYTLLEL